MEIYPSGGILGENQGFCLPDMDGLRLFHAGIFQKFFQCPCPDRRGHLPKDLHLRGAVKGRLLGQSLFVQPQPQGHGGKILGKLWIFLLQKGHHMVPDPVAQEIVTFIGAVGDVVHGIFGQEILDFLPGDGEHGPDDIAVFRHDAAEAL